MKLRTLFTSLFLLIAGMAFAAVSSGYYRIKSYNDKYLMENTSNHTLVCSDKMDGNYSQVWQITVSGTSLTFTNVLTGYGIVSFEGIQTEDPNYTSPTRFYPTETSSVFVFADSEGGSVGLHCDNYNNVVRWDTSDYKSKWTIEAAEVDASALAAQKATIAEATNSQLTQFFTTTACTELNSNYVLMGDANLRSAMSALPTTVQDMAVKVKNNDWTTYSGWDKTDMNFRIGTYNAYSKHDRWNNIIGTGFVFGRLTNPTGISVTAGEYLQVYVGAIPSGQNVKLEVAGLYQPTGTTYPLKQGMNVLMMTSSGNCFVNYEVDNTTSGKTPYTALSSYAPVTVHIEGGTVNGYFDLTKNYTNSDWEKLQTNLLKGSTVELKTNNLVFHLTTDLVKNACPTNMVELLGEWDKILDMEHSLMGLDEFNGYWNNTLSVTDITGDSYMYATNYGTYYHVGTVPSVMSYDDLFAGGALWGPAHENGHVFQKYINMVGQSEVSNNLFSNVAIYNNGHLTSRAANISTTFENMRNNIFWNDRDIWERTHLYFQLYQYFHILGKDADFYPELFKAFRADPMVHTKGIFISAKDDYLKFYKKCCQVSGYDLTEFFQAYGFFVIPTQPSYTLDEGTKNAYYIDDYGHYYLTVTQEDINNVKAEVAAMGLPKANIIFIEDRISAPDATYEGATAGTKKTAFSDENDNLIGQSGETGQYTTFGATCSAYTYSVNDNQVSMSGSGAVGFKVYDSTGKLFGLYNTYNFTLPDGIGTGYTIKAAGGNGTDVTATYDATAGKVESDVTDYAGNATDAVTIGTQITTESGLTSGKVYVLKTGAERYITDNGTNYDVPNSANTATKASTYILISNGDGTWKIKNYATGKYWGVPVYNTALASAEEAAAGKWSLNFDNGIAYPSAPDASNTTRGIDRSGGKVWGWSTGNNNNHKVYFYETDLTSIASDEFADKDISVSSEAAATLQTNQWYVMFDRGANHGYLYENGENKLYNTATVPSGSATDNAKYLVRIVGWDNEYYIQTGLGNFFGEIQQSTNVPTTAEATNKITLKKINEEDGHYYLQSAAGVVLDANNLSLGDATVVGWGSTAPTSLDGNNDWAFYPVEFVDAPAPSTGYDYYTINNTNSGRGALMYAPAVGGNKWVWSSGKNGAASFDANDAKFHWVLCPTGTENQYYLYNVAAQKFIVPLTGGSSYTSNSGTAYSWAFSNNAVAVTLVSQSNGTYKIKTVSTDTYVSVSPSLTCPIINYNDAGSEFTITKIGSANSEVNEQVTSALGKLADNTTPLSAVPASGTDGWYIIRIKQHGTYADKYVYHPASEINYSGTYYPLSFDHDVNLRPAIDDANYYTRISNESGTVYWQLPNGKYLYGANSKFPVSTETKSSFSMDYSANGFRMWGASRYAVPYYLGSQYFIGETANGGNAYYDIYPVDLASAGLTAWQVTIENGSGSVLMTCNRNDVVGGTSVYNNGFFFLPTGVTPESGDFSMIGMLSCTVNAGNHTITALYNPELSITSAEITVGPGNQTAGKGNEMQALLRIKATPFSDFQPTQFIVNLTGAANVDNVKVYYTLNDEIRAATASPVLLGTASATEGEVTISTASAPSVAAKSSVYYWITADVKSDATELATIDASLTSISYTNAYKAANNKEATVLDLTAQGNPDGEMRIFKTQNYLWTASHINTKYYRIPTIINTTDGGIVAFTDDRYSNTNDLGNHKIDVVARKSMDGGLTWSEPVTVAAGDGSTAAAYGYGDPAVVRTKSGKLICLMAAGKNGFGSGMLNMGYSESTDNGATWSAVKDIYSSINKNGAEITSAFTTAGKGVTFSNGRVAFAMNGKVSGTIHEFVLYSDDEGATWALSPSVYSGADESKLEIMNDNSLLVSVRRGGYNSMANRGYNRTTGDASGDGINSWNEQGIWGNDMNANGCNADILYYNRSTENASEPDVIFHTLTKNYNNHRFDLRLYMSFDQGQTWREAFQLQPGYAAYSSMQKLANGDLAIIFEDGSIGNQDKHDCFAINYVVLSAETVKAKIEELYEESHYPVATIISQGETNGSAPWGTWSPSGWADTFTTNASSGVAGVVVSANGTLFNRETDYGQRVFCLKPSAAGATDVITITPPAGYIIKGYSIGGHFWTSGEKYTLTSADGKQSAEVNTNSGMPNMLTVDNIYAPSTTFSIKSKGSTNNKFACITQFTVTLADIYPLSLSKVGDESYATLYLPFDVELPTGTDAFAVEIAGSYAQLNKIAGGLPTGTPAVIVNNNGDTKATLTLANGLSAYSGTNALKGTYVDMTLDLAADNPYYSLGRQKDDNDDYVIGFYKYKNGDKTSITLKANRAYLDTSATGEEVNGVKGFRLSWGDTDAIAPVVDGIPSDGIYYDLSGRRVSKPTRGMYIINGRKVMVR